MVRTSRRHLLVAAAASLGPWRAKAQSSRPIRILVGFAAGGGNDLIARILAQKLSDGGLGPVLVENRTGASGLIAADLLAKSAPDGTTLMVASQTTYAVAPMLYKSTTFDPQRDVAGVAMLGASPLVLIASPSLMAKAKPGALNFASGAASA